ncbi:hypothetical protein B6U91_01620 [Candidatus Pacearchaeota archaeon ex4484_71]|nr:MAG: hypothetical protein B6U91_01620 [Candidatus Pacearchaeota archaeon ex4484_71]
MIIGFREEEREKHIEFTKKIYSMDFLEGYQCFFDKFSNDKWKGEPDEKGSIEEILKLMRTTKDIVSRISIGEDELIPFRYSVNPLNMKSDKLLDIYLSLTGENFTKIQELYFDIFGRHLQDDAI